jgi:hypothetical protein
VKRKMEKYSGYRNQTKIFIVTSWTENILQKFDEFNESSYAWRYLGASARAGNNASQRCRNERGLVEDLPGVERKVESRIVDLIQNIDWTDPSLICYRDKIDCALSILALVSGEGLMFVSTAVRPRSHDRTATFGCPLLRHQSSLTSATSPQQIMTISLCPSLPTKWCTFIVICVFARAPVRCPR